MIIDSFHKDFAVLCLLLALTQNYAIANVNNVPREQISLAKVLVSYLKVPWFNLNGTWTDGVTSTCRNDVAMLFESAEAGDMWALQMLDSASKVPSGVLTGNIRDLGMYDECLAVKGYKNRANIEGRHCMVSLSMPSKYVEDAAEVLKIQKVSIYNPTADVDLSLTTSLCLPSSCSVQDVVELVNSSIQSTPGLAAFEVNVAQVTCSNVEVTEDLVLGRLLAMSFFAVVIGLLLFCTVCDFVVRARSSDSSSTLKTVAKFSLYTNTIKLASTKTSPDTMPAIHGIRFLNACLVVIGHRTVTTLITPAVNLSDAYAWRQTVLADFIHMLPYVVDTFFVMSGFLTANLFLTALRNGTKFNMPVLYVHRYLRLTPCIAVLLLFNIFFLPRLGSGPLWETVTGAACGFCRKNWWTNLLYVQNLVNSDEMCMLHTWYVATEMQLFWICPIILYPLFHRPKFGLTMLGLFSVAALIAPAAQLAINEWAVLFNVEKNIHVMWHEFFSSYPVTYNRVLPYLIGIFLGYDVVNNKRRLSKVQLGWNWLVSGVLVLFSAWITYFIQPNAPNYNVFWEVAYVSVARLAWSIAAAWALYACTQGYGGLFTRFLSLPMFVPLSRMCYSIYLVHFVIQVAINATIRSAGYLTPFSVLYLVWGDLALSIAIAFFLTLCFESPVIALEKILLEKRAPEITDFASTKNQKELSAVIKEYLHQSRGEVNSDLSIERTMPQLNLWLKAFEVLNTSLDKEAMDTPEGRVLQDWKAYFPTHEHDRKTRAEDVQNFASQIQIGTPTVEKELLIFLAGVSCGLNEASSSQGSEITEKNSQSEFCGWQNENHSRLSILNSTPFVKKRSKFSGPTTTGSESSNGQIGILP